MRHQEAPYCIQIELALGCNLQCSFCGLNGVQERPGKGMRFMTPQTAEVVAKAIAASGWNPRLEFARRGEPSMNPDFIAIIEVFRRWNPTLQIMMTSNGGGFLRRPGIENNVARLFEAGLNILVLDDYRTVNIVPKIRAWMYEKQELYFKSGGAPASFPRLYEYPADKRGNPHQRYPKGTKFISFVQDIEEAVKGNHATINNHAGHGAPLRDYPKRCAKPFREVGINYDGSIDLCCIDWVSEYRIGTLHENTLEELWQHDKMNAARQYLYQGERSALRPCDGCDHPSHRVGLLPDPLGKADLPAPGEWAAGVVAATLAEGPVERPTDLARSRIGPRVRPQSKARWGL